MGDREKDDEVEEQLDRGRHCARRPEWSLRQRVNPVRREIEERSADHPEADDDEDDTRLRAHPS